jgi:hypothetical protein
MSLPGASVFLLPPRPALRDWPLAGACAGLLLGLAELALAAPDALSAPLALLAVSSLALVVAAMAALLGLVLHDLAARPSYSALVAWVAGLIGLAAAIPLALPNEDRSDWLAVGVLLCAGLALLGAAGVAARIADRSERSGIPANALWIWGAIALVVATGERACLGAPVFGIAPLALLGALTLAAAGIASVAFSVARGRASSRPRGSFARLLGGLSLLALAAAFLPQALPWLLADREGPVQAGTPAHILILAVGPSAAASASAARGLGALDGWSGIRYEPLVPESARALEALLTLPDGADLVPMLAADGYATAAILADAGLLQSIAAREIDAQPSGRARLEHELRWLAAAPWLVGPGRPALDRLGLGGDVRSPAQLASDARDWLLRRAASPTPFFLLVDFRRSGEFDPAESTREEEAAASLLNHLDEVGLSEKTVVLLARTGGEHEPPLRVVVRPPLAWLRGAGEPVVARPVQASELGATLRQIARSDGVTPIEFPGVLGARPGRAPLALAE